MIVVSNSTAIEPSQFFRPWLGLLDVWCHVLAGTYLMGVWWWEVGFQAGSVGAYVHFSIRAREPRIFQTRLLVVLASRKIDRGEQLKPFRICAV